MSDHLSYQNKNLFNLSLSKMFFLTIITFFISLTCFSSYTNGQPYILYIHPVADTNDFSEIGSIKYYRITKDYIQKINLLDNSEEIIFNDDKRISPIFLMPHDSIQIVVQNNRWIIYNIFNNTILHTLPVFYESLEDFISYKNTLYGFSPFDEFDGLIELFEFDLQSGSIRRLLKFPFALYGFGITASNDFKCLYFPIEDTSFTPRKDNLNYIARFSIELEKIIEKHQISEFGYPNADSYIIYRGRNGKAIVGSFFRDETKVSYFRLYDLDNNVGSKFIFYKGHTTPYFTGNGDYLFLPEITGSAPYKLNTGKFFVYEFMTSSLIKTITFPPEGKIYTFDNYPNDIYYVIDVELPERKIFKISVNSETKEITVKQTN